jgi:hypothetical protein
MRKIIYRFVSLFLPLALLVGCASKDAANKTPPPGSGIAEYRRIADDALKGLGAALAALDKVSAQTSNTPPKVVDAFSEAVERLEVESITIRARGQAMQARGDAYFQQWHENLARIKDPAIRELARQHKPELEKCFANIKQYSLQAREAFNPFLAGLRKLRVTLETNPNALQAQSTREMIQSLKENGLQVQHAINSVKQELKNARLLITPGAAAKPTTN